MNRLEAIEARLKAAPAGEYEAFDSGAAYPGYIELLCEIHRRTTLEEMLETTDENPRGKVAIIARRQADLPLAELLAHAPADLKLLLEVARAAAKYVTDNDECPSCGVWLDGGKFAHVDGCALGELLREEGDHGN